MPSATELDPRLAVAIHRAEQRRDVLEELAGLGMAIAREVKQRFVEGPTRSEGARDPVRAFAVVSRAVRLTLALEARVEKQILAWRKGDLSGIAVAELPPEPFLKPRLDSPLSRRERVRDAVAAVIERESGDPEEGERLRERVHRELIETERLGDHRLAGDFRACVEAICFDLGLEPDWSQWNDEAGFAPVLTPHPPEEAGEVAHDAKRRETEGAQGHVTDRRWAWPSAPSTASRSPSPVVARATGEEWKRPWPDPHPLE